VKRATTLTLSPELPILGYARRMTAYKRPDLLFADLARLRAIAQRFPFQIVLAGKAHPLDAAGKEMIRACTAGPATLGAIPPFVYDMQIMAMLVAGADVW
jgi:starch phosphorylase